jgi:hypothetical protein
MAEEKLRRHKRIAASAMRVPALVSVRLSFFVRLPETWVHLEFLVSC